MLIEKDYDYVFQGPCKINKKTGKILVKGIEIEKEKEIKDTDYFSVVPRENSEIETTCSLIAKFPHLGWEEILYDISDNQGTILLLGDTDSGKTYFSSIGRNMLNSVNIDVDVGQSTLFIPSFISSFNKSLDLEFFGSITPSTNPRLHVELTSKIFERNKAKITIIDTDGWIKGFKAYLHKLELIYTIDPDYIISFDRNLSNFLPSLVKNKVINVNPVPNFLAKNRSKRIMNRARKYMEYFLNAKTIEIEYEAILGNRIAENLILAWGESLQLTSERPCYGYYISKQDLKGLLLGLSYRGRITGAGYIKDLTEYNLKISTPVTEFDGIIPGSVSLNDKFEDKKIRFRKC